MSFDAAFPGDPVRWLLREQPDEPVFFFDPAQLRAAAERFRRGFPGEVTYAVKANPDPAVIAGLAGAGIGAFDVASPAEMALVRRIDPRARLHYHNPVRSGAEIAAARDFGVVSWSVDRMAELDKLGDIAGQEIAVRLKLPVAGAAYDFGSKFGAEPEAAVALLKAVAARGGVASMTFHPGTQCDSPAPWTRYIAACADCAAEAGVRLARLNTGGGFAAHRGGAAPDLEAVFAAITEAARGAFGEAPPVLVCEPGRALVAESVTLALRVKALSGGTVFLNDGVYGGLGEWRDMAPGTRIAVLAPDGTKRRGVDLPREVFGPTCDSLDRLPCALPLPADLAEGDWLLISAMGAYALAIRTGFNGYGARRVVTLGPGRAGQPGLGG